MSTARFQEVLEARLAGEETETSVVGAEKCESTLPSGAVASDLLDHPSLANVGKAALSVVGRAGIIGAGLYVFGEREHLVRNSLAGSLAVETFVLAYLGLKRKA